MSKHNVIEAIQRDAVTDVLTEMLKTGAQELIHRAVQAELGVFMKQFSTQLTDAGQASVVRNGYHPEREIQTGIGSVPVRIPKVRSRGRRPVKFHSALVPPYVRKAKSIEASLPWLYLKGLSTGEMNEALNVLVGSEVKGLPTGTISRLKLEWKQDYQQWQHKPLNQDQWLHIWADGICSGSRSEDAKLCKLVIIGVNERGQKYFLAIEDGVRESKQSWREILLKLKHRGMNAPQLAIGDGALGFWKALDEIYGNTHHQRSWA